ncbi:hypothetical protein N7490_011226 [Penicillium lividum]|nr:hypothetical protein N7490_011226 [Penicillium lividum]
MKLDSVCSEQICLDERITHSKDIKNPAEALLNAVKTGEEDHVWLLLTRSDVRIEVADHRSRTPLSWATINRNEGIVKLVLERGGTPEPQVNSDQTPLSCAANNEYESIVKLLLEKNDTIETLDWSGRTPLLLAAHDGHESVIKLLLDKGATTETWSKADWQPLLGLKGKRYDDIVHLLNARKLR